MSEARISRDDVVHVARLARLALSEEEIDRYSAQLAAILEHAASVSALDLGGIAPMSHPLPMSNVLRDDIAQECLERDEVMEGAPSSTEGRFLVPRILEEE